MEYTKVVRGARSHEAYSDMLIGTGVDGMDDAPVVRQLLTEHFGVRWVDNWPHIPVAVLAAYELVRGWADDEPHMPSPMGPIGVEDAPPVNVRHVLAAASRAARNPRFTAALESVRRVLGIGAALRYIEGPTSTSCAVDADRARGVPSGNGSRQ